MTPIQIADQLADRFGVTGPECREYVIRACRDYAKQEVIRALEEFALELGMGHDYDVKAKYQRCLRRALAR